MLENQFQSALIKKLKASYDFVIKLDPNYIQGIPDLLILHNDKWATLECKRSKDASKRPNQEYYISKMDELSFSRFIYPENEKQVLQELKLYFEKGEDNMSYVKPKFKEGSHALFSASKYHWINYSEDKMIEIYVNSKAKKVGTELHELAALLIKNKRKLPDDGTTLSNYVNDAIQYGMNPEVQLYYSEFFFGTADALTTIDNILRIHDLKTGKTKPSMKQLYIYVAYYLLENGFIFDDFKDIETRLYWGDLVLVEHPTAEDIVPIMDKIISVDKILQRMKEEED